MFGIKDNSQLHSNKNISLIVHCFLNVKFAEGRTLEKHSKRNYSVAKSWASKSNTFGNISQYTKANSYHQQVKINKELRIYNCINGTKIKIFVSSLN